MLEPVKSWQFIVCLGLALEHRRKKEEEEEVERNFRVKLASFADVKQD